MKSQSFRFLMMGQSLANLGDVLYIVGLISILYEVSESPFILALFPFINMFGRFSSGVMAPLLLDQYRLKSLLVFSQVSKTIFLFFLLLMIMLQGVPHIIGVLAFVLVIAFLDGWALPASHSMLPRLVEKSELVKANSFFAVVNNTIQIGGWALGGVMVVLIGGQQVIWLTFVLFVLSILLLVKLVDPSPFHVEKVAGRVGKSIKEGWNTIWKNPLFRSIHVVIFFEALANVVWIASILLVFVSEILQESEAWWGYVNTSFFVGMVVGGVICSRFANSIELHLKKLLIIFSFGTSIVTLLFGFNTIAWFSLGFAVLNGIFDQIKGVAVNTYLQKGATAEELPKIYAAQGALIALVFGVSSLFFGGVAEILGVRIAFLISGLLLLVAAIYVAVHHHQFSESLLDKS
ncbi:MFS transporter [Jeotgalibacillus marinus]|uniref:MFS transporter n=1 Tax=Jeotgalibacillus marinus TaxID=86667 RepID=A0ABV3Q2U3_9BACL